MPTLTILCGLPGSGKSTWAKNNRKENEFIVNYDSLRSMLHGGEYVVGSKVEKLIKNMTRDMIVAMLMNGFDVIVDNTNLSKHTRQFFINIKLNFPTTLKLVGRFWFGTPEQCLANRMNDDKGQDKDIWRKVIFDMYKRYDGPKGEAFDEIIFHDVETYSYSYNSEWVKKLRDLAMKEGIMILTHPRALKECTVCEKD